MMEWIQPLLGFISASLLGLIALVFGAMFLFFSGSAALVVGQFLPFVRPWRVALTAIACAMLATAGVSWLGLEQVQKIYPDVPPWLALLGLPLVQGVTGLLAWGVLLTRERVPFFRWACAVVVVGALAVWLLSIPFPALAGPGMSAAAIVQLALLGLWPLAVGGLIAHRTARPVEWFLSLRYLVAKRRQTFISIITVICVVGVGLGVAVITVVLSVMNGFSQVWEDKILGARAHFVVHSRFGPYEGYDELRDEIALFSGVEAASPFIQADAMVRGEGGEIQAVILKGIDPTHVGDVTTLDDDLVAGSLATLDADPSASGNDALPGVVLGAELADRFFLRVGDSMILISPLGGAPTPLGPAPRLQKFRVAGIFRAGFFQFDESFMYTSIVSAQKFMKLDDVVSGIEVRTEDPYRSQTIASEVTLALGTPYFFRDWKTFYPGFFNALKTERTMMFVLLSFIMVVAGFIIIATLIMMIMEKSRDIAILKAMGCADDGVQRIFAIEGFLIGIAGVGFGLGMGLVITKNLDRIQTVVERVAGFDVLPANVYQLQHLPSQIVPGELLLIAAIAMVLSIGATLLPCWQAARLDPAEGLRYE